MSEFKSGCGCWFKIFIIFLLLTPRFWLCFVPGTYSYQRFHSTGHVMIHKNCAGNIRVITGAIEMYNMDQNEMLDDIDSESDLQMLVDRGYLKHMPQCAKYYTEAHPYLARWLGWEGATVKVPDCYEGHDLSRDGKIRCRLHGAIDD